MLIHAHDRPLDDDEWRAFLVAQAFGHLIAAGEGRRYPVVVPTQYVVSGDAIVLHLAAINPIFDALRQSPHAVLSVAGDWAYIPSAWKAIGDEDPAMGIPTTYYAAVQIAGRVEVVDDPDAIASILRTQLGGLEPNGGYADPSVHRAQLRAIRGIRLALDDVRAKLKYGGNVDADHRAAVAERLRARNGPGDAAALAHLERRLH